ncbi:glycoside hydrolase family 6 protein [Cellulosimicrobium terreum]|nr:glycoside hydrolase family 6 protein [Cellulosimicrobium terreum]
MPSRSSRLRKGATVVASLALLSAPLVAVTAPATAAEARVTNPFAGATQYVNPYWSENVEAAAGRAGGELGSQMLAISEEPTAVWMDRISAIEGNADGPGLRSHLDEALAQKQAGVPMVFNLVIYDLPGRDCYALASNGELPATDAGLERYKTEYIDAIVDILDDPRYESLRIAATIEPDSLPNLITNISTPECQQSAPYYRAGVGYALDELYTVGNVYSYIDAAHAGWLGWPSNSGPAAKLFKEVVTSTRAGYASVTGFVSNTANSTPLREPFLEDVQLGSTPVRSASFYEWNSDFDETDWTAHLYDLLVAEGFPASIGMLIDTSRNGWGGDARPTAVSTSTNLNTYVDESRVDQRIHRGAWCNPAGAGIGERPQATPTGYPESHLHAYVWVKPPGESDGASTDIPNDQGKRFDRMCDPTFVSPKLANQLTGALPGAPLAGQWFETQFEMLVENAYPIIEGDGGPVPGDTVAPSVPTALVAGTTTTTSATVRWTASTDDRAVTGYSVLVDGAVVGTTATTSYTVTGLEPGTSYAVTVRARDAAGNVSTASAPLTVTTAEDGGPGEDTQAPTAPTGLRVSGVSTSSVSLAWNASSDDTGVTGYRVYRDGAVVAEVAATSYTDAGLEAGTSHTYAVRALDAAGNVSATSGSVSGTTEDDGPAPGGACTVRYTASSWNTGFTGSLRITNDSGAPVQGWALTFAFADGQTITQGWSAQYAQQGSQVTVTPAAWNTTLGAGASVEVGFNGSHSGTNAAPTAFELNGATCTVG